MLSINELSELPQLCKLALAYTEINYRIGFNSYICEEC